MVVGIDIGKGKQIMTLNCVNKNEETKQAFMSSGAKKGFVIGCAEKVPENYSNVTMFLEKTQVEKICPKYVTSNQFLQVSLCFGECNKDRETGKWIKGSPRSAKSVKENQTKLKEETDSDRKN